MSLKENILNLTPIYTEAVKCLLDWLDSKKIEVRNISTNAILHLKNGVRIAIFYPNEDREVLAWSIRVSHSNHLSPFIDLANPNLFNQIEYWISVFEDPDDRRFRLNQFRPN